MFSPPKFHIALLFHKKSIFNICCFSFKHLLSSKLYSVFSAASTKLGIIVNSHPLLLYNVKVSNFVVLLLFIFGQESSNDALGANHKSLTSLTKSHRRLAKMQMLRSPQSEFITIPAKVAQLRCNFIKFGSLRLRCIRITPMNVVLSGV